jgi:hypothetical protein
MADDKGARWERGVSSPKVGGPHFIPATRV